MHTLLIEMWILMEGGGSGTRGSGHSDVCCALLSAFAISGTGETLCTGWREARSKVWRPSHEGFSCDAEGRWAMSRRGFHLNLPVQEAFPLRTQSLGARVTETSLMSIVRKGEAVKCNSRRACQAWHGDMLMFFD